MIDLHTHSSASDGSESPSGLVALAARSGLSALAITDHDSIAGLDEGEAAALSAGIRFIRGVEIEIAFKPGEFHLLGLAFPGRPPRLEALLADLGARREERNRAIIRKMADDGLPVSWEALKESAGSSSIGRPHIAELLVRAKVVRKRQQAFDRFIGKGKPYYLPKSCVELAEAVDCIHASRGLAIVAHPMSLFVSWTRITALFDEWKEAGIDGIEAWHPTARKSECERLERLAREKGFRVTAGSDFHGSSRPDRKIGITAGHREIPDSYLSFLDPGFDAAPSMA